MTSDVDALGRYSKPRVRTEQELQTTQREARWQLVPLLTPSHYTRSRELGI